MRECVRVCMCMIVIALACLTRLMRVGGTLYSLKMLLSSYSMLYVPSSLLQDMTPGYHTPLSLKSPSTLSPSLYTISPPDAVAVAVAVAVSGDGFHIVDGSAYAPTPVPVPVQVPLPDPDPVPVPATDLVPLLSALLLLLLPLALLTAPGACT
jgi:hypothetical protein